MPAVKLVTVGVKVSKTFVPVPADKVPFVRLTVNQTDVLLSVQFKGPTPVLVSVKVTGFGLNGPPTCPLVATLVGKASSESGTSYASTSPLVVELLGDAALFPMPRLA